MDAKMQAALDRGIQAAEAEKEAAKTAEQKKADRLTAAYNAASKVAEDSGLRATLTEMDEISGGRLRLSSDEKLHDGSIRISINGIHVTNDKHTSGSGRRLGITIKGDGEITATGDYMYSLQGYDTATATTQGGNAEPIVEFVAKYAHRRNLFSPKN
jgi:hypothetical protein